MDPYFTYTSLTPFEIALRYTQPQTYGTSIAIDAPSYMAAIERYVNPSTFSGVRDLAHNQNILNSGRSYIPIAELLTPQYGFETSDFFTSVNFRYLDVGSAAFANNSFIYGIAGFDIHFDGVSIADGVVSLVNYRIVPQPDNFDAATSDPNWFTRHAFEMTFGDGPVIEMNYVNVEGLPITVMRDTHSFCLLYERTKRVHLPRRRPACRGCLALSRRDTRIM